MVPGIYVAASSQHGGKTLISLGLIRASLDRGLQVGYMKPVGQRYVQYGEHRIDEDAVLVEETFHLGCRPPHINPVTIPQGFTAKYIANPDPRPLERAIREGYEQISAGRDLVVLEGTGHAGVGSVIELSNARVAQLLEAQALTVTSGGVGKPIDEFYLGASLFEQHDVTVAGAVANRMTGGKFERVKETLSQGLRNMGYRLLGALPLEERLETMALQQLVEHLDAEVLAGEANLDQEVSRSVISSMSTQEALEQFGPGTLALISGDRSDIIHAALLSRVLAEETGSGLTAICLTGGTEPDPRTRRLLGTAAVPVLRVTTGAFETAHAIADYVPKIRPQDTAKIELAQQLVLEHVETDRILDLALGRAA